MEKQPNILWIIIDHMAFTGHHRQAKPDYHWPNLETLAAEGVWFDRGYTTRARLYSSARQSYVWQTTGEPWHALES